MLEKKNAFEETATSKVNAWAVAHDEALMHLSKEMGRDFLLLAFSRSNAAHVLDEATRQFKVLENNGIALRKDNLIQTGLLDLVKLGLTPEEAAVRREQLAELKKASASVESPAVQVAGGASTDGKLYAPQIERA